MISVKNLWKSAAAATILAALTEIAVLINLGPSVPSQLFIFANGSATLLAMLLGTFALVFLYTRQRNLYAIVLGLWIARIALLQPVFGHPPSLPALIGIAILSGLSLFSIGITFWIAVERADCVEETLL